MARKPTIHRGAIRTGTPAGPSEYELRVAAARRGAATKAELQSLREHHGAKVVAAGWALVKNRSAAVKVAWFEMLRAGERGDVVEARRQQELVMAGAHLEEPYGFEWRDDDYAGLWY